MADDEERIVLFIDHENLSIGAREIGRAFDVGPIMDALAEHAMELAYERGVVSTFVIASGGSDFTPLVAALRGLNRRVIGIGVKGSPSGLLPPACDEFLF